MSLCPSLMEPPSSLPPTFPRPSGWTLGRDESGSQRTGRGGDFEALAALVTGGASGIGAAVATALRDRGVRVAVLDRPDRCTCSIAATAGLPQHAVVFGANAARACGPDG